jgi:methyl-accepting chemotaxis protein
VNISLRSETDMFGQTMEMMRRGLRSLIQQIRTSAEQMASSGALIASLTDQDIQIAQRVRTSVEEMIATMSEMDASVKEVAKNMETLSVQPCHHRGFCSPGATFVTSG